VLNIFGENLSIYRVSIDELPECFPTHKQDAAFWESLGRAVATFGFLEEVLLKAIFSFSSTTKYSEEKIEAEYLKWGVMLEKSLSDQLWALTETYVKVVKNSQYKGIVTDELKSNLFEASSIRNVLCHGSWGLPNAEGASIPFFINKKKEIFDSPIDVDFLNQVQQHVKELCCDVINTVTQTGLQFPGFKGPGKPLW
jgi:uncharacterized protein (DUF2132 family)